MSAMAMFVGDDAGVRRRTADFLRARRYTVTSLRLEADVMGELRARSPKVIVIELERPRAEESLRLLRKVRAQSPRVPILVVTGGGSAATLEKVLRLGHVDFIKKPFETFELDHRLPLLVQRAERGGETSIRSPTPKAARAEPLVPGCRELHDPDTGRLDARRIADYLGVSLSRIAGAIGRRYQSVHKSPSAESLQEVLAPLARIIEVLQQMLGERSSVLIWLNRPHPDLGGRQPLQTILEGHPDAVETLLENSLQGIPS